MIFVDRTTVEDTVDVEVEISTPVGVEETKVGEEPVMNVIGTPRDVYMAADTAGRMKILHIHAQTVKL